MAKEDEESPLMPFSAKIGAGLNDREDAHGRERHKITKTKVVTVTVHTNDDDFRIIVSDILFVLGEKEEGCGCCETEGESMVNDDKEVIILMLLLERSVLDFEFVGRSRRLFFCEDIYMAADFSHSLR